MPNTSMPEIYLEGVKTNAASMEDRFETRWHLPKEIAQGSLKRVELRPGFNLNCSDYKTNERLVREVRNPSPAFGIGFCISGRITGRAVGMSRDVSANSGQSQLFYFPDQSGIIVNERDTYHLGLTMLVDPDVFYAMIRDEMDSLPPDFRRVVDGSVPEIYQHSATVTPKMHHAFRQMLDCPYKGFTRRLFLESKAMELIALRLQALIDSNLQSDQKAGLFPADMEKINHAADLLSRELKDPPSLFTLAKTVGLSHVKLNRGFRALFGTTAFGYLRQIRLQNAKKLLETRQMNVTEAAFAVGYNSLSSFSRAFANQYGLQPHLCYKNPSQSPFGQPGLAVAGG